MSQKKYQIFISSTYEDLKEERRAITEAVLEEKHIPIGMEIFSSSPSSPWNYIEKRILECDYYVLIVGMKYGAIDSSTNDSISFTEREYNFAVENGIPTISFIISDNAKIEPSKYEEDPEKSKKLKEFKEKIKKNRLYKKFSDPNELKSHFKTSLNEAIKKIPRPGWVKTNSMIIEDRIAKEDLKFVKDLLNNKIELIISESLKSFFDEQDVKYMIEGDKNIEWRSVDYKFNDMYKCMQGSDLFEYMNKKHYEIIYIAMREIKEKVILLLSSVEIKIDYKMKKHFYQYLTHYDDVTIWYREMSVLVQDSDVVNDVIKLIKNAKDTNYKKSNLINPCIRYFNCLEFMRNWIIEYFELINDISRDRNFDI